MKGFWDGYVQPPAKGQRAMGFGPPAGTDPEAMCRCGHRAADMREGHCIRCGCTVWDPVEVQWTPVEHVDLAAADEVVSDPAATILDEPEHDSGHSSSDHEPEETP